MSVGRYSILVLGVAVGTLALSWPLLLGSLGAEARLAVLFGLAIALGNTIAAHALVRWSANRSTTAFFRAVLGGMVGRMALMLAALVAGLFALGLPRLPLAFSLLSYFVVFLAMELTIQHRQNTSEGSRAR